MTTQTPEPAGAGVATVPERERTADRLLRSTAARAYDPDLDIDWAAPLVEGAPFMKLERCSLYGTPVWEQLTQDQRIELSKHEAASVASVGLWLEFVLMRMLAKLAYNGDPTSARIQYALAETAEECRHSTMFARMITRMGAPAYGPSQHVHRLGKILPAIASGPLLWGAILIGEEITDRFQREMVEDERIQPLMRMVNRIHILEEARHIGFARDELARAAAELPGWRLPAQRALLAHVGFLVTRSLINPEVYRAVGLDPRRTHRIAMANPHHQETIRFGGEKIMAVLDDAGLVGAPGMHWWKASFLVA
ncbi:MAG TPA: diiron oxygenase [Actinocrinis sp.]|jgi:hypothetical protein